MTFLPKLFEMAYTNTQFNRIQKKKLLEKKVESLKLRHKTHSQRYIILLLAVSKFDLSFLDNKVEKETIHLILKAKIKFFAQNQVIVQCKRGIRPCRDSTSKI